MDLNSKGAIDIQVDGIINSSGWGSRIIDLATPSYNLPNSLHHNEFRKTLRESIKNGKPILIAKTDKYRGVGKTSIITNYLNFVGNSCLFVPCFTMKELYVKEHGISKERIIVTKDLNNIHGYINCKNFIMDEIPFKDYNNIRLMVCSMRDAKLSGIVTINEDYLVL